MWRLSGNLKFEYLSLASQHLHPLSLKYLLHTVVTLTTVTCLTSIHSLHRHRSFTVSTSWSNLLPFCGCLPDLGCHLPTWPCGLVGSWPGVPQPRGAPAPSATLSAREPAVGEAVDEAMDGAMDEAMDEATNEAVGEAVGVCEAACGVVCEAVCQYTCKAILATGSAVYYLARCSAVGLQLTGDASLS